MLERAVARAVFFPSRLACLRRRHTSTRAMRAAAASVVAVRVLARASFSRARASFSRARAMSRASPTFVDTHAHVDVVLDKLSLPSAEAYLEYADAFAREHGAAAALEACVTIGCSEKSLASAAAVVDGSERMFGAYGCHPLSAREWTRTRTRVREMLTTGARVVAVGETGLDYHRIRDDAEDGEDAEAYKTTQREAFAEQMRLATELGLPLIVHTREAETDTVAMMKEHLPADARVHVHCFTSSVGMAMELLRAFPNLCLGFTGVSTFKNGQDVRDTIKEVPLDRILLETDSPYMAPVPFRGQTCHPAMGERVAHAVAAVHEVDVEEVFARCRENTRRVYGI